MLPLCTVGRMQANDEFNATFTLPNQPDTVVGVTRLRADRDAQANSIGWRLGRKWALDTASFAELTAMTTWFDYTRRRPSDGREVFAYAAASAIHAGIRQADLPETARRLFGPDAPADLPRRFVEQFCAGAASVFAEVASG